jgi:hypothetical protein
MANGRVLRKGEKPDTIGADWSYSPPAGGITNSTADVAVKAAVAGKRNYVTGVQFGAGVALATASELVIKDGATVLWRMSLANAVVAPQKVEFDPPLVGSVNTAVNIAAVTLFATGNLTVDLQGYTV